MTLHEWITDLPARLENLADQLDDLANAVWVTSDEDRDRIFTLEAQIWRIAQTARKANETAGAIVPFLERSLTAARSNVRRLFGQPVAAEDEAIDILGSVASYLHDYVSELEVVPIGGEHIQAIDEPYIAKVGAHMSAAINVIEASRKDQEKQAVAQR